MNQDEQIVVDETTTEEETSQTTEDTSTDVESIKAEYEKKLAEAEAKAARYRKQASRLKESGAATDDTDLRKDIESLKLSERKRQFGYQNNLSPEETDMVFKFSTNPSKEDIESPFVKGGLEAIRAQRRASEATPTPTRSTFSIKDKTFSELSTDEKDKEWAKRVAKLK
jgi:hypothetical protein